MRFLQSPFFKNIAFLSMASLIGKIAGIIALPILSRLYTPEAFGHYSIYFALLMAFPLIASMKLDFAVTISREKNTARLLAVGAFISLTTVSTLSILIVGAMIWLGILPYEYSLIPFICISIFFAGGCDILRYWGVRYDQHGIYGKAQVAQSFSVIIAQLALFFLGAQIYGLIMGDTISRLFMFAVLFHTFRKEIFVNIKWGRLFRVIKAYITRFMTYTLTNFLHVSPNIVLPIFITSMYSEHENGFYLMGYQIIFSVTSVIISSLSQVLLGKMATLQKDPDYLLKNLNRVLIILAALGFPCMLALVFFGPQLYTLILGDQWARAGHFAQILAPAIYIQLALAPVLSIFMILRRPEKQLVIDFVWSFATMICLILTWYYKFDAITLLTSFSIVTALSFVLFYFQIMSMLKGNKRRMLEV